MCSRWSTGNSTPTSTSTPTGTWPGGTRRKNASRCGCASDRRQRVRVGALELTVDFDAGEEMLTEVSCKFHSDKVTGELAAAGLRRTRWWTDERGRLRVVVGREVTGGDALAERWRSARPPVAGLHLDNAACSRQSLAVIDADRAARPQRGRGRWLCRGGGGHTGARRRACRIRRADRNARRRNGFHHRLAERAGSAAGQLAGGTPNGGLPARRIRAQPGPDGSARIRPAAAADHARTAGWRSTTRRWLWTPIRRTWCT